MNNNGPSDVPAELPKIDSSHSPIFSENLILANLLSRKLAI